MEPYFIDECKITKRNHPNVWKRNNVKIGGSTILRIYRPLLIIFDKELWFKRCISLQHPSPRTNLQRNITISCQQIPTIGFWVAILITSLQYNTECIKHGYQNLYLSIKMLSCCKLNKIILDIQVLYGTPLTPSWASVFFTEHISNVRPHSVSWAIILWVWDQKLSF